MHPVTAVDPGGGPSDDGAGVGDGPVDDVVVGAEEQSEDGGDAGFGFAGELHLDRRPPIFSQAVRGFDDAVREVERPAAETFAELPFAHRANLGHRLGFGADEADGVAVGDGGQGGFGGPPGEAGDSQAVGGEPDGGGGGEEAEAGVAPRGATAAAAASTGIEPYGSPDSCGSCPARW